MKLKTVGWARLTALVEEHGAAGATELIVGRVANGEKLSEIGESMGIPYGVLYRWVQDDADRAGAYKAALEAKADEEAHRMLEIADSATPEDVAVARLRADTRKWLVSKWGRKQYGDESSGPSGFGGGITIVIGEVKSPHADRGVTVEQVSQERTVSEEPLI